MKVKGQLSLVAFNEASENERQGKLILKFKMTSRSISHTPPLATRSASRLMMRKDCKLLIEYMGVRNSWMI